MQAHDLKLSIIGDTKLAAKLADTSKYAHIIPWQSLASSDNAACQHLQGSDIIILAGCGEGLTDTMPVWLAHVPKQAYILDILPFKREFIKLFRPALQNAATYVPAYQFEQGSDLYICPLPETPLERLNTLTPYLESLFGNVELADVNIMDSYAIQYFITHYVSALSRHKIQQDLPADLGTGLISTPKSSLEQLYDLQTIKALLLLEKSRINTVIEDFTGHMTALRKAVRRADQSFIDQFLAE